MTPSLVIAALSLALPSAEARDLSLDLGLGPALHLFTERPSNLGEGVAEVRCADTPDCGWLSTDALGMIGGTLSAPLRIGLSEHAAIRVGPRIEYGGRSGSVLFNCEWGNGRTVDNEYCDGTTAAHERIFATGHPASVGFGLVAVGVETGVPAGSGRLYFGAGLSGGAAFLFEDLGPNADGANVRSPTNGVLDCLPTGSASCDGPRTRSVAEGGLDASRWSPALGADLMVGYRASGGLPWFAEVGYSAMAPLGSRPLKPFAEGLDLRHGQFSYNPFRFLFGVSIDL